MIMKKNSSKKKIYKEINNTIFLFRKKSNKKI